MMTFADRLTSLRMWARLSQAELARRADCHPSYINRLESGDRMPERAFVDRLGVALNAHPTDRAMLMLSAGYVPDAHADAIERLITLDPATRTALIDLLTGARDALEAMHQEVA